MDPLSLIAGICVCLTGHERFGVREAATVWLTKHADCAPVLLARGPFPSEEVRQRCRWAFRRWAAANGDAAAELLKPRGWECFPWADQGDVSAIAGGSGRDYYLCLARQLAPRDGPRYWSYSEATRLWIKDLLVAGLLAEAQLLVQTLAEGHRYYCRAHGLPVPPPVSEWENDE